MGKNKKQSQNHGIPEKFLERLTEIVGSGLMIDIRKSFVERPTTFRINTLKGNKADVIEKLRSDGFKFKNVLWNKEALILENKSKRELTDTDIYKEGKIYIQSLASMVPPLILDPQPGEKVLDLTAAPGSKTSQMAALMKREGTLVANDNNKIRFFKLKHNMEMLGVGDGIDKIVLDEGGALSPPSTSWKFSLRMEDGWKICDEYVGFFDKILVDAPCSAEARFIETDPKSYSFWKEHKISEMAYKQRKLLLSVWQCLKPGGTLVYSTCTFAPEENEMQIDRLLERYEDAEIEEIKIEGLKILKPLKQWKNKVFTPSVQKGARILPTKDIEGFFIARVGKR